MRLMNKQRLIYETMTNWKRIFFPWRFFPHKMEDTRFFFRRNVWVVETNRGDAFALQSLSCSGWTNTTISQDVGICAFLGAGRRSQRDTGQMEEIPNNHLGWLKPYKLWENIVLSSTVDPSSTTQKLCLENTIKLYIKVRSLFILLCKRLLK